jgi:lambda family phage portal protein
MSVSRETTRDKKTLSDRVDDLVGFVSPRRGARRKAYRQAMRYSSAYYYQGAKRSRLTSNWATGQESADASIWTDLQILRDRSRDLNRNNAVASGLTGTFCANTIQTGITPQCRVDSRLVPMDPAQTNTFQIQAEAIWNKWSPWADSARRMNIDEIQSLAVRQIIESGEFLSVRRSLKRDQGRPYMMALDIIEPDRLDSSLTDLSDPNTRFGITANDRGEPITYHILKTHPGDIVQAFGNERESVKVPAVDPDGRPIVFHMFPILRPGQTRGIPFFAPVIDLFKQMADYLEAEVVAARIAACFAAFIKVENAYGMALGNAESGTDAEGKRLEGFEPGMIEYLKPGESVEFANPTRPGVTFDVFMEKILRMIGAALGLPYELVLKDFSKTNYSSARAALLQAYRVFKVWQRMIVNHLLQPLWELLIEEAWLRGELTAPSFQKYRWEYCRCAWIPCGWQWVDPLKEVEANKVAVEMGFKTRGDVCAEQGEDWEEKAEQAAREKAKYEELGIPWAVEKKTESRSQEKEEEEDNAETK